MNETFGQLFRRLRNEKGNTLKQVAEYLGVSVTYISDVERTARAPFTRERIRVAAEFLDVHPNQLFTCAAEYYGAYRLSVSQHTRPAARHVGARLMERWAELSDEELGRITQILDENMLWVP